MTRASNLLDADQIHRTGEAIASAQLGDGGIPWFRGGQLDPWDHVEAAMALGVAGFVHEARLALEYSARSQRADGSWPMRIVDGVVESSDADTNQCAYLAVGAWHHYVLTGDRRFVLGLWPAVRAGIEFVLGCAGPDGRIGWAVGAGGPDDGALLAGNASIFQSLRCATALGELAGDAQPEWELAAGRLGHVVSEHPEVFLAKSRYAMDWYYPVLAGAVHGDSARAMLAARWDDFVVPGHGIRCVDDHPWVTGAETCELVMALDACGRREQARALFADMQHLRCSDGSYWTGRVLTDGVVWPQEHSTWTAAAVVLAADSLCALTRAGGLFRGETLGARPVWKGCGQCVGEGVR